MIVDIRVLGPISMTIDRVEVDLGDRKQQIAFGVLALERRIVEKDRLAKLLWEEDRFPQNPDGQLYGYVKGIRNAFEEAVPGSGRILRTWRSVGYGLEIGATSVDYHRFRERAAQAGAAGLRDPETAARLGREALAEWGSPAGVRGGLPLNAVEPQLELIVEGMRQEYQAALMACLHAELACGRHTQLLPELARLASYDEYGAESQELARIRMLASHRAGDSLEAQQIYERLQYVLDEKFCSEPDKETKALKKQILADDPALLLPNVGQANPEDDHANLKKPADPAAEAGDADPEPATHQTSAFIANFVSGDENRFYQAETMTFHERGDT